MSEGHIARHRNYSLLMKRHHRDLRIRRLTIVLIYVLLLIAIAALFIVMRKDEQRRKMQPSAPIERATTQQGPSPEFSFLDGSLLFNYSS